jgi:hypothetical protein
MWRIFAILCAASALAACQSGAIQSSSASGFDLNLVGKPLVINEPVTIPAGRARVFLQGGGVLGQRGLGGGRYNLYEPHCALEIDSVDHDGFIVPAGEYLVTRVERSVVSVVSLDSVKLASSTLAFGPLFQRSDRFHDGFSANTRRDQSCAGCGRHHSLSGARPMVTVSSGADGCVPEPSRRP